ncbi:MAG: hypothetical protein ABJA94_07910 [Rhodoglobus sp.]
MTIPKWLLPVIAVVAALAIGVAGLLVGSKFAVPTQTTVAAPTVLAPVLGPIDPSVAVTADSSSPELGSRTVTKPGTFPVGTIPSDINAKLDGLAAADDPSDPSDPALLPGSDPSPGGDPCSPADGSAPPADCPGGLHSVILHTIALPALTVSVTRGSYVECAGTVVPDGSLLIQVVTNAPAATDLTWQQDGGESHTIHVASTGDQNDTWQRSLSAADSIDSWIWVKVCYAIPGIDPWLGTRITTDATDFQSRHATNQQTLPANLTPTRPPADIIPVGNSTVFVSAPSRPQDEVRIRAFAVPDGDTPNCDNATDITGTLQLVRPLETHTVSRDSLTAMHYDTSFTLRTSTAFAVPAQTRIMVCVRWYAEGRAAWDRDTPAYLDELILVAPQVVAPVVTLDSVVLSGSVAANAVQITGSTEDGIDCGSRWSGPTAAGSAVTLSDAAVVCDFNSLLGRQDADGSLNVVTHVQTDHGLAVMEYLLPIQLSPCADGCAARTRAFDVPLSTFVRPTGICIGDCPTNTGQSAGTARVTAHWPAQAAGGNAGWYFGEHVQGVANVTPPDYPRMDDTAAVVLGAVDVANRSQSATLHLRTDRPVSYRVDLQAGACLRPGGFAGIINNVGTSDSVVQIPGLCLGSSYNLRVTLSDAEGDESIYSAGSSEHFWLGGQFFTQPTPALLTEQLTITKPDAPLVYIRTLQVDLDFQRSSLTVVPAQNCFDGAITPLLVTGSFDLAENIPVSIYVNYSLGTDPQAAYLHPDGSLRCSPGASGGYLHFTGSVTLEQISAGASVQMTDPTTGYIATLSLHNYHP